MRRWKVIPTAVPCCSFKGGPLAVGVCGHIGVKGRFNHRFADLSTIERPGGEPDNFSFPFKSRPLKNSSSIS
jgi:hypothetical protein